MTRKRQTAGFGEMAATMAETVPDPERRDRTAKRDLRDAA